ncbi:MAG: hypothetical protein HQM09_24670 [Candidatus Riflebacteria bacterium]|nr:hypothetical protein [Candidatus Riflebacteria bacterium]
MPIQLDVMQFNTHGLTVLMDDYLTARSVCAPGEGTTSDNLAARFSTPEELFADIRRYCDEFNSQQIASFNPDNYNVIIPRYTDAELIAELAEDIEIVVDPITGKRRLA